MKLALAAALAILGQDFEKSKHPWLRWAEGSWVKIRMAQEFGGRKMESTLTSKLVKISDKDYTLSQTSEMGGQSQTKEDTNSIPVKDGEETLEAAGEKYECVIWKSTASRGETRVWVPKGKDFPVKFAAKGQQSFELVATKVSDSVEVAGGKYGAVKLEGKFAMGGGEAEATLWYSAAIPGGTARMEMKMSLQGQSGTMTMEAVEFEAKK